MDFSYIAFFIGLFGGIFIGVLIGASSASSDAHFAEFVCESHGLELIDFEVKNTSFSKVECGNKKPELQYDNYKVFTK